MLYPIITKYTDKKEEPFFSRPGELQQVNKFMGIVIYQQLKQENKPVPQGGVPEPLLARLGLSEQRTGTAPALKSCFSKGCSGHRQGAGHREGELFYSPAIFSFAGATAFRNLTNWGHSLAGCTFNCVLSYASK